VRISPALRPYDAVLLDLDGCLWVGDDPIGGAAEAVSALREAGKAVAFLTNDARHGVEEYVRKLWRLGFVASVQEVVTVGSTVQYLLAGRGGGSAFVVGTQALVDHVADAGLRVVNGTPFAPRADVVVVSAHDDLRYAELRVAVQAVLRGAQFLAAGRDRTFPMPDGPWPAAGAIVAAVEHAAGRPADVVVGKPSRPMFDAALDRLQHPEHVLVVGDRLDTDVAGAHACGLAAALVLSGATSSAEALASADPKPEHVARDLGELVLGSA
jgi:HAD superfamily hydrolase (TIGR01450 family)